MIIRIYTKTILMSKLESELENSLPGLVRSVTYDEEDSKVCLELSQEPTLQEDTDLTNLINNHVPTPTTHQTLVSYLRNDVWNFVNKTKIDFLASNIEMGITLAGKTKVVADYLRNLNYYMDAYSLYEAVGEIDKLISEGIPTEYAPFVTDQRLTEFKNKILDFLGE